MPDVSNITVQFGTNRAETSPGEFGAAFCEPTPTDKRLYVTGTVQVAHSGVLFEVVPGSIQIDPPSSTQRGGRTTIPGIVSGDIPEDERFARFTRHSRSEAQSKPLSTNRGLFFLPGFANTFVNSIESAARIAVGYGEKKIICFSWPSLGKFGYSQYIDDQIAAIRSGPAISLAVAHLLAPLRTLAEAERPTLHLVCHSMGAHALSSAIRTIHVSSPELLETTYFPHTALMAADEDDDGLSSNKVLSPLLTLSKDVNVYTNRHDLALALSGGVNRRGALSLFGPHDLKTLPKRVIWLNCTVAADREETSGHGHSYFDQSPLVMNDVRQVFEGNAPDKIGPRCLDPNPLFDRRRYTVGNISDDA